MSPENEYAIGQVWECTHGYRHHVIDVDAGHAVTVALNLSGFWRWAPNGRIFDGPEYANRLTTLIHDPANGDPS